MSAQTAQTPAAHPGRLAHAAVRLAAGLGMAAALAFVGVSAMAPSVDERDIGVVQRALAQTGSGERVSAQDVTGSLGLGRRGRALIVTAPDMADAIAGVARQRAARQYRLIATLEQTRATVARPALADSGMLVLCRRALGGESFTPGGVWDVSLVTVRGCLERVHGWQHASGAAAPDARPDAR